jgi:aryl-alcohol dehydrogenase-like predicted oxidoreductase
LDQSLEKLRTSVVYGLLLHDAGDLLGPYREAVWNRLDRIRGSGRARKIGVSVYEGHEIDRIVAEFDPDIVQLPINAIDGRLEEGGQLGVLSRRNIEVHARSVFLQGLLLQDPTAIAPKFGELRIAVAGLRERFAEAGLSVMEGLLAEVFRHRAIDRVIVGVTRHDELDEIAAAADKVANKTPDMGAGRHRITDPRLLNPALWNTL